MKHFAPNQARAIASAKQAATTPNLSAILRSSGIHPKLRVGAVDDPAEAEADRIADRVMRMPEPAAGDVVHRKCAACEEDELHRKESPGATRQGGALPPAAESLITNLGPGAPLPASERAFFEPRFGRSLESVRIHDGAAAHAAARSINARAFARGNSIAFGCGEYQPGNGGESRGLLAHEIAHLSRTGPDNSAIFRMEACPPRLPASVPTGWQPYHGNSSVFHCGFSGILETRIPTRGNPQNECFYDHSGVLVDESHPYSGCRGTPNEYDSSDSPKSHAILDSGGIVRAGLPAFVTSRTHDLIDPIALGIRAAQTVSDISGLLANAAGRAIALGVLTARATANPANWQRVGLAARSIRHLNVVGMVLTSVALNGSLINLLTSMTRRLDSYPITGLISEIADDINSESGESAVRLSSRDVGEMSLVVLVQLLQQRGLLSLSRDPTVIAREDFDGLLAH
jgi:Domain of unknown function (DUF4157)